MLLRFRAPCGTAVRRRQTHKHSFMRKMQHSSVANGNNMATFKVPGVHTSYCINLMQQVIMHAVECLSRTSASYHPGLIITDHKIPVPLDYSGKASVVWNGHGTEPCTAKLSNVARESMLTGTCDMHCELWTPSVSLASCLVYWERASQQYERGQVWIGLIFFAMNQLAVRGAADHGWLTMVNSKEHKLSNRSMLVNRLWIQAMCLY